MITESNNHLELKRVIKKYYSNLGFEVKEEVKVNTKIVDLGVYYRNELFLIVECIHAQSISNIMRKLQKMDPKYKKEIVRFHKTKNPKARKIINQVRDRGIIFTEIQIL